MTAANDTRSLAYVPTTKRPYNRTTFVTAALFLAALIVIEGVHAVVGGPVSAPVNADLILSCL